jgi:uncharacterized membrane protein
MSILIAIAYPNERQASEVMDAIKKLHADGAIDLEDAVAVTKDGEGRVKLDDAVSRTAAGAAGGLVLGALVGLIVFAPAVGAIFGAASGALAGKLSDVSRIDDFTLQVGDNLTPGSSAILMLVREAADPDKALAKVGQYGGKVIRTTLPDDAEARIRAALGQSDSGAA